MAPRKKPELWTTEDVAQFLGLQGNNRRSTALRQLKRWNVEPVGRTPGREGGNQYRPADVKAAHATRTGQGIRTPKETQ